MFWKDTAGYCRDSAGILNLGTNLGTLALPNSPNSLLLQQLELEARVGIGRLIAPKTAIICMILQGIQADCVTIGDYCFTLLC